MKNNWKLTLQTKKLRQKGNYFEQTTSDALQAVRCISGSYRSFAKSFGDPQAYTPPTFSGALDKVYQDFRQEYAKKKLDDFKGTNDSILSRFAQVLVYPDGKLSSFSFGGSTVTLLRNCIPRAIIERETTCQAGDLLVINLEGESSTEKLIKNGALKSIENDFPLLIFEIEKEESKEIVPPKKVEEAQREEDNPGMKIIPPLVEVPEINSIPTTPDDSGINTEKKESGKKKQWIWLATMIILTGLSAWIAYPYVTDKLPKLGISSISPQDTISQAGDGDNQEENSPAIDASFPKTDSILKIYYAKNPRELPLLDEAIQTLKKEQNNQTNGSSSTLQTDLQKERTELVNQIKITYNEYLRGAQLAVEEGKLPEANKLLAKAEQFFNSSLKKGLNDDAEIKSIRADLMKRIGKVESLKREDPFEF